MLNILLVLSQDATYTRSIQQIEISAPPWLCERSCRKISLGGLLIIVVLRVINSHLSADPNIYIHTLCVAVLSNCASTTVAMEKVVALRLLRYFHDRLTQSARSLFETVPEKLCCPGKRGNNILCARRYCCDAPRVHQHCRSIKSCAKLEPNVFITSKRRYGFIHWDFRTV